MQANSVEDLCLMAERELPTRLKGSTYIQSRKNCLNFSSQNQNLAKWCQLNELTTTESTKFLDISIKVFGHFD